VAAELVAIVDMLTAPLFPVSQFDRLLNNALNDLGMLRENFWSGLGDMAPEDKGFGALVDMSDKENEIEIAVEVPGVKKEDIKVEIRDGHLLIRGKKEDKKTSGVKENGKKMVQEISYGEFSRVVPLPEGVDSAQIKARLENGVLHLTIPKPEVKPEEKPQQIEVEEVKTST